jgi:hypothetical protein
MAQDCAIARGEHRAEACFAVHHVLVRLGRTLERKNLAHRPHAGKKLSVSWESMEVPEGQPITERLPRMSGIPGTCSGSAAAPRMINLPLSNLHLP